tara:strand:- start:3945 stop:5708 length:1764 start_codon:yes stop_codon:yes gene_type:complete
MPTILELFQSSGLKDSVKADNETLVEQETSGIRVKSLVELNNPILYGNESIRIVNRTTEAVEKQRTANSSAPADGGLIGKGLGKLTGGKVNSISEARDKVNSTLGIPVNLIPTDVAKGLVGKNPVNTSITLEEIRLGGAGTGLGKFLKSTGGGNPSAIAKQAIGKGIDLVKGEIRGALFGKRGPDEPAQGEYKNLIPDYGNVIANRQDIQEKKPQKEGGFTYSSTVDISAEAIEDRNDMSTKLEYVKSLYEKGIFGTPPLTIAKNIQISENKFNDDKTRSGEKVNLYTKASEDLVIDDSQDLTINIDKVSYTPTRGEGKTFGGKYGFRFKPSDNFDGDDFDKQRNLENKYSTNDDVIGRTLEGVRGMTNKKDIINQSPVSDEDILVDGGTPLEDFDLIPLVIKNTYSGKRAHFRCSINGLTETTSPSWDSSKFLGNPFNLYTYSGVERSVNFNLQLFALNANELVNNWEKLKFLTYLCYPTGYQSESIGYVIPPFIKFTLGDMYNQKDGFIESLSYTIPDSGVWETGQGNAVVDNEFVNKFNTKELTVNDLKGYKLPKFIDVSITIKFVEQRSTTGLSKMYSFKSIT